MLALDDQGLNSFGVMARTLTAKTNKNERPRPLLRWDETLGRSVLRALDDFGWVYVAATVCKGFFLDWHHVDLRRTCLLFCFLFGAPLNRSPACLISKRFQLGRYCIVQGSAVPSSEGGGRKAPRQITSNALRTMKAPSYDRSSSRGGGRACRPRGKGPNW